MASNSARNFLQRSTTSAKSFLFDCRKTQSPLSFASSRSQFGGLPPTNPTPSSRLCRSHHSFFSSRLPVELVCAQSLMPLHSVTASALLKSLLSSEVGQWGCLSEGFATPL
ncbi:unnamed protein product [Ilex paraguariensis]|uniref:Uncharacterized protein n=1 Tax=Ilex paraguariensis TaxID=185542 RepID=A0ABC8T1L5_9AQUA